MTSALERITCPKCGAKIGAGKLKRHLRFTAAKQPVYCVDCGEEITHYPNVFQTLLSEFKKRKMTKLRRRKMAKAIRKDEASRTKNSKSILTVSGGAFESNRRSH